MYTYNIGSSGIMRLSSYPQEGQHQAKPLKNAPVEETIAKFCKITEFLGVVALAAAVLFLPSRHGKWTPDRSPSYLSQPRAAPFERWGLPARCCGKELLLALRSCHSSPTHGFMKSATLCIERFPNVENLTRNLIFSPHNPSTFKLDLHICLCIL